MEQTLLIDQEGFFPGTDVVLTAWSQLVPLGRAAATSPPSMGPPALPRQPLLQSR